MAPRERRMAHECSEYLSFLAPHDLRSAGMVMSAHARGARKIELTCAVRDTVMRPLGRAYRCGHIRHFNHPVPRTHHAAHDHPVEVLRHAPKIDDFAQRDYGLHLECSDAGPF